MARGDQLGRQWKIIQSLISARHGISARPLADELGCHPRTVYRDLEALQAAGFPLYTERREGKTLWSVLDAAEGRPPLPLNLAEVMALYFSCNLLKQIGHTVFHDSMESLFSKIRAMLPAKTADFLDESGKSLHVGFMPHKRNSNIGPVIDRINTAVSKNKRVLIQYYTMSRRRMTTREVAPYSVFFHNGTFYLIGHCHSRGSVRTFAIDRIQSVILTEEHFTTPRDFDIESYTQRSFGVFQGAPVSVCIWFAPAVADYIGEKQWHPTQRIIPAEDGSIQFEATVAGTREIKFWVLQWGAQARVLHPSSLQKEIEDEITRMQALYTEAAG